MKKNKESKMFYKLFAIISLVVFSTLYSQQINATTDDGKKVILNDNGTWEFAEINTPTGDLPVKFIQCKFEKLGTDFGRSSSPYSSHVRAYFQFENKSDKATSGIQFEFSFNDAFGDVLYDSKAKSNIIIKPNKKNSMDTYYYWEDNEFIGGEPYDKIQSAAGAGTLKTTVKILTVVFEDGSVVKY